MKIALITTLPDLIENKRIEDEVQSLGHDFVLINFEDFGFSNLDGNLQIFGLEEKNLDLAIVRGIFKSVIPVSAVIEDLRKKGVKVFDNNFSNHKYSIDKVTDLVKLSFSGIKIPKTSYSRSFDDYYKLAEDLGYPVVVKSTRSGKGAKVYKLNTEVELRDLLNELEAESALARTFILQEFVDYEFDLRCLVIGEDIFTMRRIPAEGEFRANFSLGGAVETFDLDEEGKKLALEALSAVDMTVGGVDILLTKDNLRYILEVNHTAGFVGMEKAQGKNIGKIFVEHAIKEAK